MLYVNVTLIFKIFQGSYLAYVQINYLPFSWIKLLAISLHLFVLVLINLTQYPDNDKMLTCFTICIHLHSEFVSHTHTVRYFEMLTLFIALYSNTFWHFPDRLMLKHQDTFECCLYLSHKKKEEIHFIGDPLITVPFVPH